MKTCYRCNETEFEELRNGKTYCQTCGDEQPTKGMVNSPNIQDLDFRTKDLRFKPSVIKQREELKIKKECEALDLNLVA